MDRSPERYVSLGETASPPSNSDTSVRLRQGLDKTVDDRKDEKGIDRRILDERKGAGDRKITDERIGVGDRSPPLSPETTALKVIDKLSNASLSTFAIVVTACALMSAFVVGYNISVLNGVQGTIIADLDLCDDPSVTFCDRGKWMMATANSVHYFGACVASLVAGKLNETGRRFSLLVSCFICCLGGVMCALCDGVMSLILGRFVKGCGMGISSVSMSVFLAEFLPPGYRGVAGVLGQLNVTIGIVAASALALLLRIPDEMSEFELSSFDRVWWRVVVAVPAVLSFVLCFVWSFIFVFETPFKLIEMGRPTEAMHLLQRIRQKAVVTEEFDSISQGVRDAQINKKRAKGCSYMLRDPWYRWALFCGVTLSSMSTLCTGVSVFLTRSTAIFIDGGLPGIYSGLATLAMGLVQIPAVSVPMFLVDRMGRRPLFIIGFGMQAMALIPAAIVFNIAPHWVFAPEMAIAAIALLLIAYRMGPGSLQLLYASELYPGEIRSFAMGLCMAATWGSSAITPLMMATVHNSILFPVFAVLNTVACIFVILFIQETKGCSLENSPYFVTRPRSFICESKKSVPETQMDVQIAPGGRVRDVGSPCGFSDRSE